MPGSLTIFRRWQRQPEGRWDDVVKLNIFLTDLTHFPLVNEIMAGYFSKPYPARAAIGVAALPKDAGVEMDAVMPARLKRGSRNF